MWTEVNLASHFEDYNQGLLDILPRGTRVAFLGGVVDDTGSCKFHEMCGKDLI